MSSREGRGTTITIELLSQDQTSGQESEVEETLQLIDLKGEPHHGTTHHERQRYNERPARS